MATYKITLQLINPKSQPLAGLTAQVWIADQKKGDALTDKDGNCSISFALPDGGGKKGVTYAYLLIYMGDKWIYGEKDNPKYALNGTELNLQVTINARRADLIPLTLKDFRLSAENLGGLAVVQQSYVAAKLNQALQAAVQRALEEADTRFQTEPVAIALDYTQLLDKTLGAVLTEKAIPVINTIRSSEPDNELEARLAQNPRSVREILHIDQPMIKNPIFYEAVQVLRTTNLTDMMLPGQPYTADYLLERSLDWERASTAQWEALATEGIVSEAGKTLLQRGFALSRFTGGQTALVGGLIQEIEDLSQIVIYDAKHLLTKIKDAGNETPNGEAPEEYAANLEKLAQRNFPSAFFLQRKVERAMNPDELSKTYRHLGVQGATELKKGQKHLRKFREDNIGFDLRTADFFKKDDNGKSVLKYDNIPENFKAGVRKQMMAFQRVARLAGSYEAQDALLAAGLDSSSDIIRLKPAELETMLGGSLSPAAIADIAISAEQQFQVVVNGAVAIQGISSSQSIGFAVDNYPEDLKNQLQDIDGYAEMFGSQDYCECTHCKSIFGPAAYFVDLMKFTEEKVILMDWDINKLVPLTPNPEAHPISLRTRRPDLWQLELTCENTNAVVPYLLIINEIKQRYITEVVKGISGIPANYTVDIWAEFAKPFAVSTLLGYQQTRPFVQANTWKNSFRLPFNRPFEESQILLEHFEVTYTEVLQALRVSDPTRLAQAYLGVSAEEWQVLVTPDSSLEDLRNLRFGFPADRPKIMDVEIIIDPGYALKHCPVSDFQRATGLNRADAEFLLSDKSSLYAISNKVKLVRKLIPGELQQYEEWIEGLDNTEVLDFIHRLLRLKRHLPWTLRELDLVVSNAGKLSPDHIVEIAEIREMQRVLQLTVEEAVAFQWAIPDTPLYTRTVYNELLNASVEVPVLGMLSRQFDLTKLPLDGSVKSLFDPQKLPFLLQGWGATESEFEHLYRLLLGTNEMKLDLTSVSFFYRLHRMAKGFGLSGEEMAYLLKLDTSSTGTSIAAWALGVAQTMEIVRKMPLSLHEMWFVLNGEKTSKIDFQYQGDAKRLEDAGKAAQQLMTDFVQDKRLYMYAEGILKQQLPSKWFVDVALPISDNLLANKFFKKTADGNFQIRKAAPLSFEDIPDHFKLKPGSNQQKQELLDENLRSSIADAFNAEWSKIRNQIFGEHFGLLFKTTESLLSGMMSWYANTENVLAEAQANFAGTTGTYATVELVKVLPVLERLTLLFHKLGLDTEDAR
ncbi:MAG: hypothetical protein H7246_01280, partial [Phycisphaerae bacterium]|nr:hypothetical protein [Saprospiraceae bacterium]